MGRIGRAVAAVTALILAGCQYELGTVPHAVDQPTATGRAVTDIVYHDGRLWVGYGDWGANTGPIEIVAYNLATRQWEHHATARTEAVHNLEVIDGTLWVLYTDPMSKGDVLRRKPDGTWQELSLGENGREAFLHVFDIAEAHGSLWLVGSQRGTNAGLVMRSDDGGDTWQVSLTDENDAGWNRFYSAFVIGGDLHVRGSGTYHADTGWDTDHFRFDGTAWHYDPFNLMGGYLYEPSVSLDDRSGAVMLNRGNVAFTDGAVNYSAEEFGPNSNQIAPASDLIVHGEAVYVVLTNGQIYRSQDFVDWELVAYGPDGATSLTVDPWGTFYVGTAHSTVWVVRPF